MPNAAPAMTQQACLVQPSRMSYRTFVEPTKDKHARTMLSRQMGNSQQLLADLLSVMSTAAGTASYVLSKAF